MPSLPGATAELFDRLLLERGSLAPPEARAAEKAADEAARAELLRRGDAVATIAEGTARGRGATDALGRHRHVVACGLAVGLLLAIGGEEAMAALFAVAAAEEAEALAAIHRAVCRGDEARALLDPRCEPRTLRVALRALPQREGPDADLDARLRALAGVAGIDDVLDPLLAAGNEASYRLLVERALADPRAEASAVRVLLDRFEPERVDEVRAIAARAGDGWSIVEALLVVLEDEEKEEERLGVAFSRGEGATWWASPDEMLAKIAEWDALAGERPAARTGIAPLYGSSFDRALLRRGSHAALRPALTRTMVVGGVPFYTITCGRWHARGALHRVYRERGETPAASALDAELDAGWAARNAAALGGFLPGPYTATLVRLRLHESKGPPFGEVVPDDEDEIDHPTPIRHFAADPFAAPGGPTEIVLLPSGALPAEAPLAYAWRAPEDLAHAIHALGEPPRRTRIVGVLLQGEERLIGGGEAEVLLLSPSAWADDQGRLAAALAPARVGSPLPAVIG